MLNFGNRKINKFGGSYMISLPMEWMKTVGEDMKDVNVKLNSDGSLRIEATTL